MPADGDSLLMTVMNPTPTVAVVTILVLLSIPLLLHLLFFRSSAASKLPTFVLLGPSGGGKTSLVTYFAGKRAETRTSQVSHSLECNIPSSLLASNKYRTESDPSMSGRKRFLLLDTPGHGKLRETSLAHVAPKEIRGVIFVLDSSLANLHETASYLYDVLLHVQRRVEASRSQKAFRVLLACNKSDLFTALPPTRIQELLEEELGKLRNTRSKGVLDVEEGEEGTEKQWLGEGGSGDGPLSLESLAESGMEIEVLSGSVENDQWKDPLGKWIGGAL